MIGHSAVAPPPPPPIDGYTPGSFILLTRYAASFRKAIYEKCVYDGAILPRTITFMLKGTVSQGILPLVFKVKTRPPTHGSPS